MNPGRLLILGGGGHAAVVAESAARAGWQIVGFAAASGAPIGDPDAAGAAAVEDASHSGVALHAAVGSPDVRARWMTRFGHARFATIVDPSG